MRASTAKERAFAELRRQAGLDLQRAAVRLRINPQYLRALELGRSPLSMQIARRMVAAYSTTLQAITRPAGVGRPGDEGREASGNVSRPGGNTRGEGG